jgi:FKBP-type peptidyl-prolyl cis-trans isomerase
MAKVHERIFALMGAIVFLVTSVALSIAVVWQMVQDKHTKNDASKTATTQQDAKNGKKLQGSKLQGFEPVAHVDTLQIKDTRPGNGSEVKPSDTVTVDYTGAVAATGVIFESSLDSGQPATFALNQVIKGWTEGLPGMKVGGERRLLIPAADAYGANPPQGSDIPANADLVFDITLHSIGQ